MLKKSTLLSVSIFVLLFIGLSDYGYGCHKNGKPHGKNAGPCDPDPPEPPGGDAEYSVTITGAVFGGSDAPWTESSGGKSIQGDFRFGVSGVFGHLDLSFFTVPYPNGPFDGYRGLNCFGLKDVSLYPQASIQRGRGGRAEDVFWFSAFTANDDRDLRIPVLYQLIVLGLFEESTSTGWPPSDKTFMPMTDWVMNASNDGGELRNISCNGEGDFNFDLNGLPSTMTIEVERTN